MNLACLLERHARMQPLRAAIFEGWTATCSVGAAQCCFGATPATSRLGTG